MAGAMPDMRRVSKIGPVPAFILPVSGRGRYKSQISTVKICLGLCTGELLASAFGGCQPGLFIKSLWNFSNTNTNESVRPKSGFLGAGKKLPR